MPAVFIHGVPDTHRVWQPIVTSLKRQDVLTPALPGFDSPLPTNFASTKEEYVDWIIQYIQTLGEPVDLVGHDWGCILVARVASLRPDLVRSWAAGSGPISPNYEWHPNAKIWQTPEEGERWMQNLKPDDLVDFMVSADLPRDRASEAVSHMDDRMKESILRLYRSALTVGAEWQPDLEHATSPGLVFWGEKDAACPVAFAAEMGRDTHSKRVLTLNANHWVIVERSTEIAAALKEHWASL